MEPIDQSRYDVGDYRMEVLYVFDNSKEGGMARMRSVNQISKLWQIALCFIGKFELFGYSHLIVC